jgi:hypothetical protein
VHPETDVFHAAGLSDGLLRLVVCLQEDGCRRIVLPWMV